MKRYTWALPLAILVGLTPEKAAAMLRTDASESHVRT